MRIHRIFPVSIVLALVLALFVSLAVANAQEEEEVTLGGSATFRDASALSDSLVIALTDVPAPAAGTAYEGWLIASDGASKVSTGILDVSEEGTVDQTYVDPDGANLLATYATFAISSEPVPDPDPDTPGAILYADTIPAGGFLHIGHLLVNWPPNPDGKGIVVGLREQANVGLTHANLSDGSDTLVGIQLHAHHVINIVEGSEGANYDGSFGNPGDDIGVLNYAADAIVHANLAKSAAPDDETVTANADAVIAAAENIVTWATVARDQAIRIADQTSENILVTISLQNMVNNMNWAVNGRDADGGAEVAYTEAQEMGSFVLVEGASPPPPAPPTPTPTAVATPTAMSPPTGDTQVPAVALGALVAGIAFVLTGGSLLLWRRRRVQV